MADKKPDYVVKGESLAEAALRKVFAFSTNLPPENDFKSDTKLSPEVPIREGAKQSSTNIENSGDRWSIPRGTGELPFRAEPHADDGKRHLLLACSGSVASIKLPKMIEKLSPHSDLLSIRIVLTSSAAQFLRGQADEQPPWESFERIPGVDGIYLDEDEWAEPWTRGAPILHIELRRWADLLVIAPLSANTLAKMVNGLCDNLLTSVIRAHDVEAMMRFTQKSKTGEDKNDETSKLSNTQTAQPQEAGSEVSTVPARHTNRRKLIMVAPAMNTAMWRHPITGSQLKVLQDDWHWVKVLLPTEKALACGDVGVGAMKEWDLIVDDIEDALALTEPVHKGELSPNNAI